MTALGSFFCKNESCTGIEIFLFLHQFSSGTSNQEEVEKLKVEIAENIQDEEDCRQTIEKTNQVIASITEELCEMIFKLQEIDECDPIIVTKTGQEIPATELCDFLNKDATDEDFINIIEEKLSRAIKLRESKTHEKRLEEVPEEFQLDELILPLGSPPQEVSIIEEKPQPLPMCYMNLIAGRPTQPASTSPGQSSQPAATSDDESEIPSRAFLKKQANMIVDSKSRRKGFRPSTQRRK